MLSASKIQSKLSIRHGINQIGSGFGGSERKWKRTGDGREEIPGGLRVFDGGERHHERVQDVLIEESIEVEHQNLDDVSPPSVWYIFVDDDIEASLTIDLLDDDDPWIITTDFTPSETISRCSAGFPLSVPVLRRLFDARGRGPRGPVPNPSPDRHAATRSRRRSSSSSSPTADGFGTGTPEPSPQSQSFSRGYGSILPTSLAYIVPSTRGCSPWRPDAVMSTTGHGRHSVLRIFKGRQGRTGHHATCGALPAAGPYLRLSRFQGGQAVKQKR
ncbi:unnamed protein product [Vicia faba]|uniref:RNA-dependent RNA polymerase 6-like second domain-containing protein n=1 Tax=Vicia faba TaxID=3906 RepID=A0AAV1A2B2_VICFA|nr:unnamed protein product [Vicia faba]